MFFANNRLSVSIQSMFFFTSGAQLWWRAMDIILIFFAVTNIVLSRSLKLQRCTQIFWMPRPFRRGIVVIHCQGDDFAMAIHTPNIYMGHKSQSKPWRRQNRRLLTDSSTFMDLLGGPLRRLFSWGVPITFMYINFIYLLFQQRRDRNFQNGCINWKMLKYINLWPQISDCLKGNKPALIAA